MLFHPDELVGNVIPVVLAKDLGKLCIKRLGHVQAVEPHLRGVNFLVPEAALGSARLSLQLLAQGGGGLPVFLLPRHLIESEQVSSGQEVVEVVFVRLVSAYRPVVTDEAIRHALNVFEVSAVRRVEPDGLDAFQENALFVVPLLLLARLGRGRIFPERQHRVGHAPRQRRGLRPGGRRTHVHQK